MADTTENLFTCSALSTSEHARRAAAKTTGKRYRQIIMALSEGPACIFEVAQRLSTPDHRVHDHQISGRFGEMEMMGMIRKTGVRRTKPGTKCQANEYQIVGDVDGTLAKEAEHEDHATRPG